jgi:hypothetical protein
LLNALGDKTSIEFIIPIHINSAGLPRTLTT